MRTGQILASLVVLGAAPACVSLVFLHRQVVAAAEAELSAFAQEEAGRLAVAHDSELAAARALLDGLVRVPDVVSLGPGCEQILGDVARHDASYATLAAIDRQGWTRCSNRGAEPVDYSVRPYVEAVLGGQAWAVGSPTIGLLSRRPVTTVVVAPPPDAEAGALVASLDLVRLLVDRASSLPAGAAFLLLDREDRVLAWFPEEGDQTGRDVTEEPLVAELRAGDGRVRAPGLDGHERMFASTALGDGGLVVVGLPVEGAVPPVVLRGIRTALVATALAALLSSGLALALASRGIARPLRALHDASRRVAEGDVDVHVRSEGPVGEIRQVADAFNDLSAALRDHMRHLRQILSTSPDGFLLVDPAGEVSFANEAATRLFGRTLAGERIAELMPEAAKAVGPTEIVLGDKQIEVNPRMIHDGSGQEGMVLQLADVTSRRASEEAEARRERLEAMGRLAGSIAHDFNNLLTTISGFASLLRRTASGASARQADQILQATQRATELTRGVLAFARGQRLAETVFSPRHLVTDLESILRRLAGDAIALRLDLAETAPVRAVRGQIEQALINLVANARDAMPDGGVVSVRLDEADVKPEADRDLPGAPSGRWVRLTVADTGTGMDAATRRRIFEPFFTTRPGGTGLGLATAHAAVERAGGRVLVDSSPGEGSVFTLLLPPSDEQPEAVEGASAPPPALVSGLRAVVVDDQAGVREVMHVALADAGWDVRSFGDGAAALEDLRRAPADLLVSDVVMPGMSGPALAAAAFTEGRVSRALLVSGFTAGVPLPDSVPPASVRFLEKPFSPTELAAAAAAAVHDLAAPVS
jgi:signal transduction histidine kinase/CheY-like chemotaxis protein